MRRMRSRVMMVVLVFVEVVGAFAGGEAFYGVAQGDAWEVGEVGVEVGGEEGFVDFAYFAEHPSYGFVDEVVRVGEEGVGYLEEGVGVVVAYEGEVGDDGDALFPDVGALREGVEELAAMGIAVGCGEEEELPDYGGAGGVDKVPVVGVCGVGEVEGGYLVASVGMGCGGLVASG